MAEGSADDTRRNHLILTLKLLPDTVRLVAPIRVDPEKPASILHGVWSTGLQSQHAEHYESIAGFKVIVGRLIFPYTGLAKLPIRLLM
jgi:hypothetical protein